MFYFVSLYLRDLYPVKIVPCSKVLLFSISCWSHCSRAVLENCFPPEVSDLVLCGKGSFVCSDTGTRCPPSPLPANQQVWVSTVQPSVRTNRGTCFVPFLLAAAAGLNRLPAISEGLKASACIWVDFPAEALTSGLSSTCWFAGGSWLVCCWGSPAPPGQAPDAPHVLSTLPGCLPGQWTRPPHCPGWSPTSVSGWLGQYVSLESLSGGCCALQDLMFFVLQLWY